MTKYSKKIKHMKTNKINRVFKVLLLDNTLNSDCMVRNGIIKVAPTPEDTNNIYILMKMIYQIVFEEYDIFEVNDLIETLTTGTRHALRKQIRATINMWKAQGLIEDGKDEWRWLEDILKLIKELDGSDAVEYTEEENEVLLDENDEDEINDYL